MIALSAPALACFGGVTVASGPASSESRAIAPFHALASGGSIDVHLTVGPEPSLKVEAAEALLPKIRTEVRDGTLHIDVEGNFATNTAITVTATTPELDAVTVAGSGDVRVEQVKGPSLNLMVAGSGDITARGSADTLNAQVSGSGEITTVDMPVRTASTTVSGSGDIELRVSDALNVVISGSGDVTYHGDPAVTKTIAGSGDVKRAGG